MFLNLKGVAWQVELCDIMTLVMVSVMMLMDTTNVSDRARMSNCGDGVGCNGIVKYAKDDMSDVDNSINECTSNASNGIVNLSWRWNQWS